MLQNYQLSVNISGSLQKSVLMEKLQLEKYQLLF